MVVSGNQESLRRLFLSFSLSMFGKGCVSNLLLNYLSLHTQQLTRQLICSLHRRAALNSFRIWVVGSLTKGVLN